MQLPYHLRVMVPCYKEDLDIVQRTINAAAAAVLPTGVQRTIYLCDDGKDPEKRAWMDSMGPNFVYVSGRNRCCCCPGAAWAADRHAHCLQLGSLPDAIIQGLAAVTRHPVRLSLAECRPKGEMNGKSGNLNNCCSQLYPEGTPIPGTELIVVFDADQVQPLLRGTRRCSRRCPCPGCRLLTVHSMLHAWLQCQDAIKRLQVPPSWLKVSAHWAVQPAWAASPCACGARASAA